MPPRRNRQTTAALVPDSRDPSQMLDAALAMSGASEPMFSSSLDIQVAEIADEARVRAIPSAFIESVRRFGILTPLTVREVETADSASGRRRYALLHGRRRLEAARRLNLTHVPVRVVTNYDALPRHLMASLTVAENVHHDPSVEALVRAIAAANIGYPTVAECAHAFGMSAHDVQTHLLMAGLPDAPWWVAYREGRVDANLLRRVAIGSYLPEVLNTIRDTLSRGESVTARQATAMHRALAAPAANVEQTTFIATTPPESPSGVHVADGGDATLVIHATAMPPSLHLRVNGREARVRRVEVLTSAYEGAVAVRDVTYDAHEARLLVERYAPAGVARPPAAGTFDATRLDAMLARGPLDGWTRIIEVLTLVRDEHPVEPDNDHDAFAAVLDGLVARATRILGDRRTASAVDATLGAIDDEDRAAATVTSSPTGREHNVVAAAPAQPRAPRVRRSRPRPA